MSGVRLVINMHVVPGGAAEYAEAWIPQYELINNVQGCLQYELFRSTMQPDHLALLELWQDRATFDAHWLLQKRRETLRPDLLADPRTRTVGRDGTEIYWQQQEHRYDAQSDLWQPQDR